MVNIDIKRFECNVCGVFFTAPQSINRISNEFKDFAEHAILIRKEITNDTDGTKRSITMTEKSQMLDDFKTRIGQIKSDWQLARTTNTFSTSLLVETDQITHWHEVIKITLAMKEAIISFQDNTDLLLAKEIVLNCPVCNNEAHHVKVK